MDGNKIILKLSCVILCCVGLLVLINESINRKKENLILEFSSIGYAESVCNEIKSEIDNIFDEINSKLIKQKKDSDIVAKIKKISCDKITDEVAYEILKITEYYADKYKFDESLILGMIAQESRFLSTAKSKADARGLMQITPLALEDYNNANETYFTITDLSDMTINISIGCWTLERQKKYLNSDDLSECIISYNSGALNFKNNRDDYKMKYLYLDKVLYYQNVFLGKEQI